MKKSCILCLIIGMLFGGCGKVGDSLQSLSSATASPGPFVVHVAPLESSAPVPGETEINWQEVLTLTAEHLPDMDALRTVLPEPVSVLQFDKGDLGLDGVEDIVIVYEYPAPEGEALFYRTLAVFSGGKEYECLAFHDSLILDSQSGGTLGDPFESVYFTPRGELRIAFWGGSSWRWECELEFEPVDGVLLLTGILDICSHDLSGDYVRVCYDLRERETICDAYWYTEEEHYGVLYEYSWPEEIALPSFSGMKEFSEVWELALPNVGMPLPIFDTFYANAENRSHRLDFSAEEILDKVKEENYPKMEKVMYDTEVLYPEEISAFIGYQMPRYYYESEDGVQLYYRTVSYDADLGWEHELGVIEDGRLDYILYRDMESSEESSFEG